MNDPVRRSVALATVLAVAGFAAIGVAWFGVAETLIVPTQVAYAVSGGIGGFALLGTGIALLEVQRRRYAAARDRQAMAAFAGELVEVAELVAARHASRRVRPRRVLRAR